MQVCFWQGNHQITYNIMNIKIVDVLSVGFHYHSSVLLATLIKEITEKESIEIHISLWQGNHHITDNIKIVDDLSAGVLITPRFCWQH